jgi:hypothetical protein
MFLSDALDWTKDSFIALKKVNPDKYTSTSFANGEERRVESGYDSHVGNVCETDSSGRYTGVSISGSSTMGNEVYRTRNYHKYTTVPIAGTKRSLEDKSESRNRAEKRR